MALRREDIGELLAERMDSANSIVGSGNHALTMSQATTLNVHLGSFTELKANISTLIQQYMDQEQDELVSELFSTLYVIDECLENYKGLIPAEILNAPTPSALTDSFVSINELNQYLDDSDYVSAPISRPSAPGPALYIPGTSAPLPSSSSSSSSGGGGATCSICWMEYDPEEASELQVCRFHLFCPDCLNQFLTVKVKNGDVLEITCPANGCTEKVEPEKVQKNLTGEMFEKFERFQILTRLRLEPNARFCGKSDCDGFAVGDKNDPMFPVLTCNECGGKICFNCKTNWHPDMTCKANMREVKKKTKDDDKKFDSYLKANKTIKCSKCGAGVQKNDGCNHMRCTCGYEFCWLCGETIINPGDGCYPMHYTVGACAGMQMSSVDELSMPRKAARLLINPVKYGLIATAGAVALPFYGGFKLAKVVLRD